MRRGALLFLLFLGPLEMGFAQDAPAPMPEPEVLIRRQRLDVNDMLGQDAPRPTVTQTQPEGPAATATKIRNAGGGMSADVHAELLLPRSLSWPELLKAHAALPQVVPWLPATAGMPEPKVSPLFHALYRAKWEVTKQRMLDGLPAETPARFYDLAGAWELPASDGRPPVLALRGGYRIRPSTEPRAGSADYLTGPIGDPAAVLFNPRTAYRWKGGSASQAEEKLKAVLRIQTELKKEYAITGLPRARNRELEAGLAQRQAELADLPKWNYLNSRELVFISLPLLFRQYPEYAFAPRLGDRAVVLAGDKAYPAVIGDELSTPVAGEVSEAFFIAQLPPPPAPTNPAQPLGPAPKPELKAWPLEPVDLTLLVFTGTAPVEPLAISGEELRDEIGKLVPLPQPEAAPDPAPEPEPVAEGAAP